MWHCLKNKDRHIGVAPATGVRRFPGRGSGRQKVLKEELGKVKEPSISSYVVKGMEREE